MNNIYWLSIVLSQNGTDVGNFHREDENVTCAEKITFLGVSFLQIYSKIYCFYKVMHNVVPIKLFEVLLFL